MPHPRGSPVVQASPCPRYRLNFLQRQPGAIRPKRHPRRAVDHAARQAPADRRVVRTVANAIGATTQFQGLNLWRLSNPSLPRSLAGLGVRISGFGSRGPPDSASYAPQPVPTGLLGHGWVTPAQKGLPHTVSRAPASPPAISLNPIWTRYRGDMLMRPHRR